MEIIVILLFIGIALMIEAVLYNKWGGKRLSYKASLEKKEVVEGDSVELTEELNNEKGLPLPFVKTEIVAPDCLDFGTGKVSKENLCYIPSVFSLKGNERCIRKRKIKCTRRGVFEIGSTSLYGGDLFGLGGFSLLTEQHEKLTVLPAPLDTKDFYPSSRLLYGDIQVRRFFAEDPFLISGAHEYTGREPMNSIFWSGTARTGRIMALNKDHTTCSRVLILLTFQRRADLVAAATNAVCEVLIKAAAFAVEEAVKLGAEYSLVMNLADDEPLKVLSGELPQIKVLRRLAAVEPLCETRTADFIEKQPLGNYTDIVLISPFLSQNEADMLKERRDKGQGVYVYTPKNESDADFYAQIVI